MNPISLLKLLFKGIPPEDHTVSVDDVRKGPVMEASARLDNTNVLLHYVFANDDADMTVDAEMPLAEAGRRGGRDTITVNGEDVEEDDVIVSNRLRLTGFVIVIEFHYVDAAGKRTKVRIDAKKSFL